jgi:hypothetical protein
MVVMPPAAVVSERRRLTQTAEPAEIGTLHHAFLVDIGAQEAEQYELGELRTSSAVKRVASCQPFTTIRPPFESAR